MTPLCFAENSSRFRSWAKLAPNHGTYLPHRTPRKTYIYISLSFSKEWMIDRRPIPSKEKNWKSSGGNGRGGTKWLSLRDREKPVSDLRTRFFPRFVRCTERGSAPGVHAFYDAIYMHNVTAASTWEHGYVAISCRSFLLRDPARTVPLPTPFAPRRVEKDDRGGGQGGKARDRDARD